MPVYNRASLVQETLKSIQDQSYRNWESIVVDDDSTDDTWNVISSFADNDNRIKIFKKPEGILKGPSASRNYGLSKANGDFIHFFDSDDILQLNFYEEIVSSFVSNNVDSVITRIAFFEDSIKNNLRWMTPPLISKNFIVDVLSKQIVSTQNVLWRKNFLESTRILFNENVSAFEDIDFNIRNFVISNKFIVRNDLFVYIRKHKDSLTLSDKNIIKRNLDWLFVLVNLVKFLSDNNFYNVAVSKYAASQSKGLLMNLIREGYMDRHIYNYWLFMNKELMKSFQLFNLFIYNAKILLIASFSFLKKIVE